MPPGDVILALPSTGLHSNGYSLVRKVFHVEHADLSVHCAELGETLGEALLTPTRIYVKPSSAWRPSAPRRSGPSATSPAAGSMRTSPGCLPEGLTAQIERAAVPDAPHLSACMQETGRIPERDMYNTFNMGVGMAVIVSRDTADTALAAMQAHGCGAYPIGEIVRGDARVVLC